VQILGSGLIVLILVALFAAQALLAVLAALAVWLLPAAAVLRQVVRPALGAQADTAAAVAAVQIATVIWIAAFPLLGWLSEGFARPAALWALLSAASWPAMLIAVRVRLRGNAGAALSWPRAALCALPAALVWSLAGGLILVAVRGAVAAFAGYG